MFALTNKVAIVTGASSGIGRATARLFAEHGASVVVAARRQAELDMLVAEIEDAGCTAFALAGDVRDEAYAKALVDLAVASFGGLDIAFNNVGAVGQMGPVSELSLEGWRETLDTNLTSAFLGAKYQVPAMIERGGGSLIFTSTFVGHTVGMPGMTSYAASKGPDRIDAGACRRIRRKGCPGERAAPRRHGHARGNIQDTGIASLRGEPACLEARRQAARDCPLGALSGLRRLELHHRRRAVCRWRRLDQPDVNGLAGAALPVSRKSREAVLHFGAI